MTTTQTSTSNEPLRSTTPQPDRDLLAIDQRGRIIGPHPNTGEYVNQIPGAASSGDRHHGMEWILLPDTVNATTYIDTTDTSLLDTTKTRLITAPITIKTTHYGKHSQLHGDTVTNTTTTHHTITPQPDTYTSTTGTHYTADHLTTEIVR